MTDRWALEVKQVGLSSWDWRILKNGHQVKDSYTYYSTRKRAIAHGNAALDELVALAALPQEWETVRVESE
jgi:hypothetical protein